MPTCPIFAGPVTNNVAQASDILLSTMSITSEATSHVPTAAISHVPTAATSHVPTAATSHVPTAATSDVSIVATSEISTPATSHLSMANSHVSTATTYHLPTDEYNVEKGATMPPPRMTSLLYSDGSRPPPLIPATFYTVATPSIISPYRPFMSTAFAPGNLYESPLSRQAHRFPASVITTHVAPPIQDHQQFSNTRLPKLTLPTFSGDPLNWLTFWDSFYMTIHANPNLSGIQKFSYLKVQLQGDAARTIAGLPLTEANYTNSIALLEDRYGQRHKIVDAHMRALRDMPSPLNSLTSLRIFYDSVESHIRGLASLGKSETSYGELLVPVILDKLP